MKNFEKTNRLIPRATTDRQNRIETHLSLAEVQNDIQHFFETMPSKVGMDLAPAQELYAHEIDTVYQMIRDHLSQATGSLLQELSSAEDEEAVFQEIEALFKSIPTIISPEGERMNSVQASYQDHLDALKAVYRQEVHNRAEQE